VCTRCEKYCVRCWKATTWYFSAPATKRIAATTGFSLTMSSICKSAEVLMPERGDHTLASDGRIPMAKNTGIHCGGQATPPKEGWSAFTCCGMKTAQKAAATPMRMVTVRKLQACFFAWMLRSEHRTEWVQGNYAQSSSARGAGFLPRLGD